MATFPASLSRNRAIIAAVIGLIVLGVLIAVNLWLLATYQAEAVTAASVKGQSATVEPLADDEKPQKTTTVPDLVGLLGMNLDQALGALARGATLQAMTPLGPEDAPEVNEAIILLTAEYAPAASSQPTVVLGLDEQGTILRAGYQASMASLGYGSISFTDAIANVGVLENTLSAAGVTPTTPMVLPTDPLSYSVYGSDGRTLVTQHAEFSGAEQVGDRRIRWEAELSYDYAEANVSGNLANTLRTVAISVEI